MKKKILYTLITACIMLASPRQNVVAEESEYGYDIPDTATNLKAQSSTTGVKLTWDEQISDGYIVYRAEEKNGKYTRVGKVEYENFVDKKAAIGKKYYYCVSAYYLYEDGHIEYGNKSKVVNARKLLGTPYIKSAKRIYARQIDLKWTKIKNAKSYIVYRSETKYGTYKKVAKVEETKLSDKVAADKDYFYKIKAVSDNNYKSDFSIDKLVKNNITNLDEKLYNVDVTKQKYTYAEMIQDIKQLKKKYPNYFTYEIAGKTYDNRNLVLIRIGNKNAENQIYVQSTIHAREYMNTMVTMSEFEFYLNNWNTMYNSNSTYGDLFNDTCVYYLPMMNPDGVSISQFGPNAIRDKKLRQNILNMGATDYSRWKANARGVDINRNFQTYWSKRGTPGPDFYSGPTANSERETKTIMNIINTHKFDYILTYHSMGGEVFWNIGQSGDIYSKTYLLASKVCQYTSYGLGRQSVPEGLSYNWTILDKKIPELIIETGVVQCPLPLWTYNDIKRQNHGLVAWMISQKLAQKMK